MPIPFIMPKFDMDQEKATIVAWSKNEGESIRAEETALVVETDKVAIDVPAPATGKLAGIRYQAGETVPVTTVIAYILKEGETAADLPGDETQGPASTEAALKPVFPMAKPEPGRAVASEVKATPLATHLAKEKGIDLLQVPASGERLTKEDVEHYLKGQAVHGVVGDHGPLPATPAARRLAGESGVRLESVVGSGPRGRVQAADVVTAAHGKNPATVSAGNHAAQIVPLVGMRQTIAERMTASFHNIPHISLSVEADASYLESAQVRLSSQAEHEGVPKVTLTALLVKVVAWALEHNPPINSSLQNGQIYLWQDVNIGVATAIADGLIVPVIHQANQKSIREIAVILADLTSRAKNGKLGLSDVQHGTFTISNLGKFGIRQFRAVINPPESAILAVGAIVRKPVVINELDVVAVRPMLTMTLSADHRVIDGVVAARFLQDLLQGIEVPASLLY